MGDRLRTFLGLIRREGADLVAGVISVGGAIAAPPFGALAGAVFRVLIREGRRVRHRDIRLGAVTQVATAARSLCEAELFRIDPAVSLIVGREHMSIVTLATQPLPTYDWRRAERVWHDASGLLASRLQWFGGSVRPYEGRLEEAESGIVDAIIEAAGEVSTAFAELEDAARAYTGNEIQGLGREAQRGSQARSTTAAGDLARAAKKILACTEDLERHAPRPRERPERPRLLALAEAQTVAKGIIDTPLRIEGLAHAFGRRSDVTLRLIGNTPAFDFAPGDQASGWRRLSDHVYDARTPLTRIISGLAELLRPGDAAPFNEVIQRATDAGGEASTLVQWHSVGGQKPEEIEFRRQQAIAALRRLSTSIDALGKPPS